MYWACRKGRDFPGTVPDETGGRVTNHAILQGLGLLRTDDEGSGFEEVTNASQSSSVRTGDLGQQDATQATSPSISPSLSAEPTPTSPADSLDTRISSNIPCRQPTTPFDDSWFVEFRRATEHGYLSTLDSCKQPLPIDFSLQESMLLQPKAQHIIDPTILPPLLIGQSKTSPFTESDSVNLSDFPDGPMEDTTLWCTEMCPTTFEMQI